MNAEQVIQYLNDNAAALIEQAKGWQGPHILSVGIMTPPITKEYARGTRLRLDGTPVSPMLFLAIRYDGRTFTSFEVTPVDMEGSAFGGPIELRDGRFYLVESEAEKFYSKP